MFAMLGHDPKVLRIALKLTIVIMWLAPLEIHRILTTIIQHIEEECANKRAA